MHRSRFLRLPKLIGPAILAALLFASPRAGQAQPLDVILVVDFTGSTAALLPNWKANVHTRFLQPIAAVYPGARFALVSHTDFPFSPYGANFDHAFRLEAPLDTSKVAIITAMNALTGGGGADDPEAQYVAVTLALTGQGIDLDGSNPVEYGDLGDIAPSNIGLSGAPIAMYHFTYPPQFHDRDTEPDYPYFGAAPVPGYTAAAAAFAGSNLYYFGLVTTPIGPSPGISPQTGESIVLGPSNPMTDLANLTGGAVYDVGADLSGLQVAIEQSLQEIGGNQVPATTPLQFAALLAAMAAVGAFVIRRARIA